MANPVFWDFYQLSWYGDAGEDTTTDLWQVEVPDVTPTDDLRLGTPDPSALDAEGVTHDGSATASPSVSVTGISPGTFPGNTFLFWSAAAGPPRPGQPFVPEGGVPAFPLFASSFDPAPSFPTIRQGIPSLPDGWEVHVIGWYVPPSDVFSDDPPMLRARTFDLVANGFRKETPIAEVEPSEPRLWRGFDLARGINDHIVQVPPVDASVTPNRRDPVTIRAESWLRFPATVPSPPPGQQAKYFQQWAVVWGDGISFPNPTSPRPPLPARPPPLPPRTNMIWSPGLNPSGVLAIAFYGYQQVSWPVPRYPDWLTRLLNYLGEHGGDPALAPDRIAEIVRLASKHLTQEQLVDLSRRIARLE